LAEQVSSRELTELTRGGAEDAFTWLFEHFGERIHAHAYRLLGNRQDAEDVTQETFLRAFRSIGELRDETRVGPWLFSIASHLCLDQLRRRKLLSWLPWRWETDEPFPSPDRGPAERAEEKDLIRQALAKLPPKDALCLTLRTVEGFSTFEVAQIIGCSEAAVWNRLARARERFVREYDKLNR